MENKNEKLSRLQKDVIILLNEGWVLITSNECKGAQVCTTNNNGFKINNGVFFRLVEKGYIHQPDCPPFDYVLTGKAKEWYKSQKKKANHSGA